MENMMGKGNNASYSNFSFLHKIYAAYTYKQGLVWGKRSKCSNSRNGRKYRNNIFFSAVTAN